MGYAIKTLIDCADRIGWNHSELILIQIYALQIIHSLMHSSSYQSLPSSSHVPLIWVRVDIIRETIKWYRNQLVAIQIKLPYFYCLFSADSDSGLNSIWSWPFPQNITIVIFFRCLIISILWLGRSNERFRFGALLWQAVCLTSTLYKEVPSTYLM